MILGKLNGSSNIVKELEGLKDVFVSSNIDGYVNSIKNLGEAEAVAELKTKGLSESQIEQVLTQKAANAANQEELATKTSLLAAKQKEIISSELMTEKQLEEVTSELGLQTTQAGTLVSTKAITEEKLREVLASKGVVGANADEVVSFFTLSASEDKATLSTLALDGALSILEKHPVMVTLAAIAGLTYAAVKAYDYFTTSVDEATKALTEFNDAARERESTLKSHKDLLNEVNESYEDLSKGVNLMNNTNIDLDDASYSKFIDLNNRLAEAFPSLKSGIDESGNAIINYGNNAKNTAEKIGELIKQEEDYNSLKTRETWNDEFENVYSLMYDSVEKDGVDDYQSMIDNDTKRIEQIRKQMNAIFEGENVKDIGSTLNEVFTNDDEFIKQYAEALQQAYEEVKESFTQDQMSEALSVSEPFKYTRATENTEGSYFLDWDFFNDDQQTAFNEALKNAFNVTSETLSEELNALEIKVKENTNSMNQVWSNYRDTIINGMHSTATYSSLKDEAAGFMDLFVGNLSKDTARIISEDYGNDIDTFLASEVYTWAKTLNTALSESGDKLNFELGDLFNPIISNEKLVEMWTQLEEWCKQNGVKIPFEFIEQDDEAVRIQRDAKVKLQEKYHKQSDYDAAVKTLDENIGYSDFTTEQLKTFLNVTEGVYDVNEQIEIWNRTQGDVNDKLKETKKSYSEILTEVNGLKTGMDLIGDVYDDVKDKGSFDFSKITSDDFAETFNIDGIEREYEEFIETVSKYPNDIKKCQKAFDNLATSYINNSDALKNVTNETKKSVINQLKEMGVANARVVVLNQLARNGEELTDVEQAMVNKAREQYQAEQELLAQEEQLAAERYLNSVDFVNMTQDEIDEFFAKADAAGVSKEALFAVISQQKIFESNKLNLTQQIEELGRLAEAAGVAQSALAAENLLKGDWSRNWQKTFNDEIAKGTDPKKAADIANKTAKDSLAKSASDWVNSSIDKYDVKTTTTQRSSGSGKGSGGSGSSNKDTTDPETFDWIEVKVTRIEEAISRLDNVVGQTYKSWATRNKSLVKEMERLQKLIDINSGSYTKLNKQANAVSVKSVNGSSTKAQEKSFNAYKKKYDKGSLKDKDIKKIKDANVRKAMQEYADLRDRADDVKGGSASQRYLKEANKVKVKTTSAKNKKGKEKEKIEASNKSKQDRFEKLKSKVRNGTLDIESIKDENLANAIKEYQEWYEKHLDALDKAAEAEQQLTEAYIQAFEMIGQKYDSIIGVYEANKSLYDATYSGAASAQDRVMTYDEVDNKYKNDNKMDSNTLAQLNKQYAEQEKAYNEAIANGVKKGSEEEKNLSKAMIETKTAIQEAKNSVDQNTTDRKNAYMDIFNDIEEKFDNIVSVFDAQKSLSDSVLKDSIESTGRNLNYQEASQYYSTLNGIEAQTKAQREQELEQLRAARQKALDDGVNVVGDKRDNEMVVAMTNLQKSINDSDNTVKANNLALLKVKWEEMEKSLNKIANNIGNNDFIKKLLQFQGDFFDEFGNFTDLGLAGIAADLSNMELNAKMRDEALVDLADVNEKLKSDPNNDAYLAQQKEFEDRAKNATLAIYESRDAVIEAYSNAYKKMLDKLSEISDNTKESLNTEKDLYDYQKSIQEKVNTRDSLKKQLDALRGDNSEEARKTRMQLTSQLTDAEEDLQETQYDRFVSDTSDMLDDLQEDSSEWVEKALEDKANIIADAVNNVKTSVDDVKSTINNCLNEAGYKVPNTMDAIKQYLDELSNLPKDEPKPNDGGNKGGESSGAGSGAGDNTEKGKDDDPPKNPGYIGEPVNPNPPAIPNPSTKSNIDEDKRLDELKEKVQKGDKVQLISGGYYVTEKGEKKTDLAGKNFYIEDIGRHDIKGKEYQYQLYRNEKDGKKIYGWTRRSQFKLVSSGGVIKKNLKGYSVGSKNIDKDQLAWTQEKGREIIYRSSDGAMLTPLGKRDKVFTKEMSDNLWRIAQTNVGSMAGTRTANTSLVTNAGNSISSNIENVNLDFSGVSNYEEFVAKLKADPNYKNYIQAITLGVALGNNSLKR